MKSENQTMNALTSFLDKRMQEVKLGNTIAPDFDAIRAEAKNLARSDQRNYTKYYDI